MSPSKASPSLRNFKQITRTTPKLREMEAAWEGISTYPDGSAALIVSAWIDRHLEESLKLFFIKELSREEALTLFENQGPLESIWAKTSIAYALGIIGRGTKRNIILANHIRNVFAHAPELVTFDTPEVKIRCKDFDIISLLVSSPHIQYVSTDPIPGARYQYLESCVAIVVSLLMQQQETLNARELSSALLDVRSSEARLADLMSGRPEASFLP